MGGQKVTPLLVRKILYCEDRSRFIEVVTELKDHNGRLMRWALLLQDYTYVIVHRAGKANANADALSRLVHLSCLESQHPEPEVGTLHVDLPDDSKLSSIVSAVLRSHTKRQAQPSLHLTKKDNLPSADTEENSQQQGEEKDIDGSRSMPIDLEAHTSSEKTVTWQQGNYPLKTHEGILFAGNEQEAEALYDRIANSIRKEQYADPQLKKILSNFTRDNRQDYVTADGTTYRLKNRLLHLYKTKQTIRGVVEKQELLLVPKSLQQELIRLHHDHPTAGHFGAFKTLKRLQQGYTWKGMAAMVEQYVKTCIPCQRNNLKELTQTSSRPVIPRGPFDIVALDCLRLPNSIHGNAYVLVMVDYFTKYAHAYVLDGNPSAANTMRALAKFLGQHALVRKFRCDRGSEFTNTCFQEVCAQLGIELEPIPTEHHRANGLVERFNRTLQNALLCKVVDETVQMVLWEEYVEWVTLAYNTSFHTAIQDTPFFMVYGRHAVLPGDLWIYSRARMNEEFEPMDISKYKRDMI